MLEIPLDTEITVNCLSETHMKVEELILAAMVLCGLIREPHFSGLQRSQYDGFIWYGITWATVVSEYL